MSFETESPTGEHSANLMGFPTSPKHLSILGMRLQDSPSPQFHDSECRMDPIFSVLAMEVIVPMRSISFLCTFNLLKALGIVSSACNFQMFFPNQISANKVTHRHMWIPTQRVAASPISL